MKKSKKQGKQISLFDQAMVKPVDIQKEPPAEVKFEAEEIKLRPEGAYRPRILIGSTKTCPVCGELYVFAPNGTVRCTQCWWWQSLSE